MNTMKKKKKEKKKKQKLEILLVVRILLYRKVMHYPLWVKDICNTC